MELRLLLIILLIGPLILISACESSPQRRPSSPPVDNFYNYRRDYDEDSDYSNQLNDDESGDYGLRTNSYNQRNNRIPYEDEYKGGNGRNRDRSSYSYSFIKRGHSKHKTRPDYPESPYLNSNKISASNGWSNSNNGDYESEWSSPPRRRKPTYVVRVRRPVKKEPAWVYFRPPNPGRPISPMRVKEVTKGWGERDESSNYNNYPSKDASYSFAYDAGSHDREETADPWGNVRGSYSYVDPTGLRRTVHYTAGSSTGFKILNASPSTHIPSVYQPPSKINSAFIYHLHPDSGWKPWVPSPDYEISNSILAEQKQLKFSTQKFKRPTYKNRARIDETEQDLINEEVNEDEELIPDESHHLDRLRHQKYAKNIVVMRGGNLANQRQDKNELTNENERREEFKNPTNENREEHKNAANERKETVLMSYRRGDENLANERRGGEISTNQRRGDEEISTNQRRGNEKSMLEHRRDDDYLTNRRKEEVLMSYRRDELMANERRGEQISTNERRGGEISTNERRGNENLANEMSSSKKEGISLAKMMVMRMKNKKSKEETMGSEGESFTEGSRMSNSGRLMNF